MLKRITLMSAFLTLLLTGNAQRLNLDYYLDQAVQSSPLLKDYQNQLSAAAVDSLLIQASRRYQVDASSQLTYAPVIKGWGYDEAITNGANIIGLVGVKQELMNKQVLNSRFQGLTLQKQAVGNTMKISINDLKKSVTTQYLTAYGDFNELTFNREQLKTMNDQLALIKHLAENGVYKPSDYLSLLAETQAQELLIVQLSGQYTSDLQSLNLLCGINKPGEAELSLPTLAEKKLDQLSQSPLFLQFKIDSMRIENEKQLNSLQVKPKLNWYADAGLISSTVRDVYKHFGVSAGLNLTVPIYDGGQRKLEAQKLILSENTRASYQHFFATQYEQQVMQVYSEMASNDKVVEQVNKQLATSQQLIGIARTQLANGTIPVTDYLNALRNHKMINRMINQSAVKRLMLINELNYLKQQ